MMKSLRYAIAIVLLALGSHMSFAAPQEESSQPHGRSYKELRGDDQYRTERGERHRHIQRENGADNRRGGRYSEWKIGAPIPQNYRFSDYAIDYTQYPNLSAPSRYQQWIKVDNRFVLINVLTNTTLKVIAE